jgi:hypothetical protein
MPLRPGRALLRPGCLLLLIQAAVPVGFAADYVRPQRGDTVATRPRPDVEPRGVRVGGFRAYPTLGLALKHDDNIYSVDEDTDADQILVASPGIRAVSDWNRHAVELAASADLGRYRDFTSENYDDWQVSASTRLDVLQASHILLGAVFAHLHEPRESPDDAGGLSPTVFTSTAASVGLTYRPGRYSLSPTAIFNRLDYQDVDAIRFGIPVTLDQDDRDRNEYTLGLRGAYEIGPDNSVYLRADALVHDYDERQNVTGFDRSSDGFELGAGGALDVGVTRGRLFLGYRQQNFSDPLSDISMPVFDVAFTWKPSELTTLALDGKQTFVETTLALSSGSVATSARIKVDHELRRHLLLTAELAAIVEDYVDVPRRDETLGTAMGVTWLLNRNLALSLRYEYTDRDSSDSTIPGGSQEDDFTRHVVGLQLKLQQ